MIALSGQKEEKEKKRNLSRNHSGPFEFRLEKEKFSTMRKENSHETKQGGHPLELLSIFKTLVSRQSEQKADKKLSRL